MAGVNMKQVERVAAVLKNMPDSSHGMNFYSFPGKDGKEVVASDMYPALNHPQAVNFFFFVCLHEFGFWYGDDRGYVEPLYGTIDGKRTKGSDLLWKVCIKTLNKHDFSFVPNLLCNIVPRQLANMFSDDNGPIPFPDFEERFKMTRAYGRWFAENNVYTSPKTIVSLSNLTEEFRLKGFLSVMKNVSGYNLDNLEKRQLLLAMVLVNRPEKFLKVNDPKNWAPIVDYHLLRINLRLGTVNLDPQERYLVENRRWVSADIESDIRTKVKHAVEKLIKLSGRPMSFVDEKLWMARKYCPEMEKPDCPKCDFYDVCEKRIELFQPVFRTTNY